MRWVYCLLIRLYPSDFRRRFEDEMQSIFDESLAAGQSTALLLADVVVSLFRRLVLRRTGPGMGFHPLQQRIWWLLALCGLLDAAYSGMTFFMQDADGFLTLRTFIYGRTPVHMGMLALGAGACTIAFGIWNFRDRKYWLIVLNGLARSALGLIEHLVYTVRLAVGFHTVALLIVLMALSIGSYELVTARRLRRTADKWFLSAAGVISVGFAFAFFAFVYGWIRLDLPPADFHWVGS